MKKHHERLTDDPRAWRRLAHRGHPGRAGGFGPFGPGFGPFGPGHFGPGPGFGGRPGRARRGDVRGAILSLLAEEPRNGYGLMKEIAERTGGVWRPSPGSVYPTLQQLVDEGLIQQTGSGTRADYALTEAGRDYVRDNAEQLAAAFDPSRDAWSEQGELFVSVRKLLGAVRQVASDASSEQRERAVERIDALRTELYRILGE